MFEERGPTWRPSAMVAFPRWFSHLLPEGRLRSAVDTAAHSHEANEFDLLKLLGPDDLPGAARVVPAGSRDDHPVPEHEDTHDEEGDRDDPLLKFSLAGVQLKFSVYSNGEKLTVPARGQAGNVILKFPDERPSFSGVPEAELGCLTLASRVAIDAVDATLVSPHDVRGLEAWAQRSSGMALAVRRFDRRDDDVRIHVEEFAQVLDIPTAVHGAKYNRANFETIAVLVRALCGVDAVAAVIDRIVLNVLVGNGDAHLKNWAIRYVDGKTPTLSPLYDVLPTVLYIKDDNLGLNLNRSKSFADVVPESFDRLGAQPVLAPAGRAGAPGTRLNGSPSTGTCWPTTSERKRFGRCPPDATRFRSFGRSAVGVANGAHRGVGGQPGVGAQRRGHRALAVLRLPGALAGLHLRPAVGQLGRVDQ